MKLDEDSLCIAGIPSTCPNPDEDEYEYLCHFFEIFIQLLYG